MYYSARTEKLIITLLLFLLPAITLVFLANPLIGIVLCISCVGAAFIFLNPIWGLAIMVFFIPLEVLTTFGKAASMSKVVGLWTCLSWLIHTIIMSRKPLKTNNTLWLVLTMCCWAWASILWSANPSTSLSRFISLMLLVGLYLLVINLIGTQKQFDQLLVAYVLGAFVCGLWAIKMFWTAGILFSGETRLALKGQNPNHLAESIVLGIIFSWYLSSKAKSHLHKFIALFISIFFLYILLLSQSRGAWLAFIVATCFYLWPMMRRANPRNLLTLTLLAVCIIATVFLLPYLSPQSTPFLKERFSSIMDSGGITPRTNIWRVGIKMWKDNPILGVGLNNFHRVFNQYTDITFGVTHYPGDARDPHSVYLSVICELGLVGFILLCAILCSYFTASKKSDYLMKAFMLSILLLILIIGLKATIIWHKTYWLVLALGGASLNFANQSDQLPTMDSLK